VEQRLEGTLAACVAALDRGARLFRVHDVAAARRALDLAEAVRREGAKLLPVATGPAGNERG
jgi:dihydropteroate synthase